MDARRKALQMLKTAKAERREALNANDNAAAEALLKEVIKPLKRQIAGNTLNDLRAEAQALNALSDILEGALAKLNRRIDRFFLDDLQAKARDLALIADEATARANPNPLPAPAPVADLPVAATPPVVPPVPQVTPPPIPEIQPPTAPPPVPAEPVAAPPPAVPAFSGSPPPTARPAYAEAFAQMQLRPEWRDQVAAEAKLFLRNEAERRYRSVEAETGVPWWVIGLLHKMEASQSFRAHLHNGDSLNAPTRQKPANRPPDWRPGMTWEESAVDALIFDGLTRETDWSVGALLERAERWNGLGYRNRGLWSPFVWSGCTYYERGKFVSDGVFDADAVSAQVGIGPMILQLMQDGVLTREEPDRSAGTVTPASLANVTVNPASALTAPRMLQLDLSAFPHADAELRFPRGAGQTVEHGMGMGRRATDANIMAVRRVQEWCILHGFATGADGQFGSATETTVKAFQKANGLPQTGAVDEECWALLTQPMRDALAPAFITDEGAPPPLAELVVETAEGHRVEHPQEAGGDNAGPWVRLYMEGKDAGIGGGSSFPWCAGFTSFVIQQACRDLGIAMPFPRQALVANLVRDAKADNRFIDGDAIGEGEDRAARVPVGGLFATRGGPNGWNHTGVVTRAAASVFHTIEGNTNDEGSREGFEAVSRTRSYGKYDFIRVV